MTYVEKLKQRIEELEAKRVTIYFTPGPKFHTMTEEEQAKYLLEYVYVERNKP